MGYADVVAQDSPLGFWRLGSTAANPDGTANNRVMTGSGGLTLATAQPPAASGITFDGSSGYLSTPHVAAWNTIVAGDAWIKTSYSGLNQSIIDHDSWGTSNIRGFQFRVAGGKLSAFSVTSAGTFGTNAASTLSVNDGVVHHVAFTYASSTLTLYVDGVQNGTTDTTAGMFANSENTPLQIGTTNAGARQQWFNGFISDVAVYSTALTSAQVLKHYRAGLVNGVSY